MNSKTLFLSTIILILSGCGVKSDPVPPSGTQLPSYVDKFLETPQAENQKDDDDEEKERP